ncbi:sigma 54-interacting transcriptional regulator [Moraxella bovis]|uniref:sigma-54-dependent transcriptional regulator n=1 Tax=Moraxella bovis TaxID=476 RepID=UPI002227B301|nr:sigma 54-interacting transcriptional regulator [Moraxella bovis]UZA00051.1 sigma 54-interacting transcriptional regulator [Moraxella bovis]
MQDKPLALIIDDEADLCRLMQITLNKMGVDTNVAYDMASARAFLADNHYDFCLTDLALPDGSGMEIVELVTKTTTTPVAVITAHGDVNVAIEAMKIGAFDFVNKPLDLPRLRQLAQSALKVNETIIQSTEDDIPQDGSQEKSVSTAIPPNPLTGELVAPTENDTKTDTEHNTETSKDKPQKTGQNSAKKSKSSTPVTVVSDDDIFGGRLIGDSRPMKQLRSTIKKLARSQAPVFLWGGSGTGKEVVSRLIHDLSGRRNGNFVPVNCEAIPSELMESEFFGHKKGSFTGATSDKIGLFQQADGGTLFLDEVADLPLAMQVKLLRAIQEKTVRAIGDTKEVPVDIRIVCATHKNLADLVQKGAFRQDLFYRINVIEVKLPDLNDRRDDIPMLAEHFLNMIAKDWKLDNLSLTDDAIDVLTYHNFKGNVRELRNILERAVTMSDSDEIDAHHLMLDDVHDISESDDTPSHVSHDDIITLVPSEPATEAINTTANDIPTSSNVIKVSPYHDQRPTYTANTVIKENKEPKPITLGLNIIASANYGTPLSTPKSQKVSPLDSNSVSQAFDNLNLSEHENLANGELPSQGLEAYLIDQERQIICNALQRAGGNKTQAAKLLGMTFRSLRYRMKKLDIDDGDDE